MPATIAPTPAAVSAAANLTSTANADAAEGLAAGQQGLPGSFAALVRQLAGKPAEAGGPDAASLILPAEAAEAADALAALLPFLEAMGLTKQDTGGEALADNPDEPVAAGLAVDGGNLIALAAPIAASLTNRADAPAIPAGKQTETGLPGGRGTQANEGGATIIPADGNAAASAKPSEVTAMPVSNRAASSAASTAQASIGDFSSLLTSVAEGGAPHGATVILPAAALAAAPQQASAHSLPVPQAVGAPGWDREVGNQVAWLAHQAGGKAELVLTPPQMGRIEVSLTVSGDQANAIFVSANPAVREALESALPRLREVLAEAGIQLGQAQVGAEGKYASAQQEKSGDNPSADRAPAPVAALQAAGHALPAAGLKIGRGLVDVFA